MRRRASRALPRYLIAVGVGVAATLAWQSHGESAQRTMATWAAQLDWPAPLPSYDTVKQTVASRVPQLSWSHWSNAWESYGEPARQRIAGWVPRLGWTNPGPESAAELPGPPPVPAAQPADTVAASTRAASPADPQQIERMSADVAALRLDLEQVASLQQTVEQLAVRQEQMARDIATLQADQRQKIALPRPRPPAAPARNRATILPPALIPPALMRLR